MKTPNTMTSLNADEMKPAASASRSPMADAADQRAGQAAEAAENGGGHALDHHRGAAGRGDVVDRPDQGAGGGRRGGS